MTETEPTKNVQIEIEDENENDEAEEVRPIKEVQQTKPQIIVPRKRINELTEEEKTQLIADAKNGIESEFYNVKFFKNGNTHITLKKQTKAQELIKANESNPDRIAPLPNQTRYLTNEQLLLEHVLNIESLYGRLHAKHKKLKKRYNELEGYLYADDSDDEAKPMKQPQPPPQQQIIQEVHEQPIQQAQPYVQRRYVRSWRDIRPQ